MAGRKRTGGTSGLNLLTNLLIQDNQDKLARQRKAEDLRVQTDYAFQEYMGKRLIDRGMNPYTGQAIQSLAPRSVTPSPGLEVTSQRFGALGELEGVTTGRPFKTTGDEFATPEEESKFFEGIPQGGVYKEATPINPRLKRTYEEALKTGRITLPKEGEGFDLGAGIRSLGQNILPMIQKSFNLPTQQTAPRAVPVTPLPASVPTRQGDSDVLSVVNDARAKLDEGFTPEELIDHLISKGVDPDTAQQIVEEAAR